MSTTCDFHEPYFGATYPENITQNIQRTVQALTTLQQSIEFERQNLQKQAEQCSTVSIPAA